MKKKLLLIIPKYFSYENVIKNQLEMMNYEVLMIYENIDEISLRCKYAIKVKKQKQEYLDKYYLKKIRNLNFEVVLAIRASSLSINVINYIKDTSPNAKFFMYQWDGVKNNSNALVIAPYFDKVATFDIEDSQKYGWVYRPLFYMDSSERCGQRKYDISFIGSLHSQRLKVFQQLKKYKEINKYVYVYSKFSHYLKEKYVKRNEEFYGVSDIDIKYKSLSLKTVNKIMRHTNIVVDYMHPGQTGFTMRTCEAIGHRCKIVTNNKLVLDADFYNPSNVYVYDIENFYIPEEFLNMPYIEIQKEIFERYSIKQWIKEIIDCDE